MTCVVRNEGLAELVEIAANLCRTLETVANNEMAHCADIAHMLDQYAWDTYKMKNDLEQIKNYVGG